MAPRRVIEDSDEDDGGFATPELLSPSMTTNEAGVIPMMQPSSTDPMLFRAVYEEHLGQLLVDDQLPSHGQSPVFEDPIIDQRMSSSASISSAQKLKRSKTINISSLSSITEPTLSNRKSKRTESTRGVDDLTQITTPRKSKDATRKDPWEVPTSSASDKPSDMDINVKIRSRNAERNNTLKTYGRRIRRTQTVGYTTHTTSNDRRLSSPLEDDITQVMNQNRSLQNQEDDDLPMPRPKRHKVGPSENVDLLEPVLTDPLNTTRKEAFPASGDFTSIDVGSMPIQVHQCASEHADIRTNKLVGFHTHEFCSLSFTNRTIPDGTVKDSHPGTESSAAQASRKSLSSIVVVPDTLSDEQKFQYAIVSVASTAQSRRSSLSEMTETYDPHMKYTRDSSTVPDGTALPNLPLGTIEDSSHATQLSSSPPVSAMNRKMKRSRSEVGSKRIATSATTSSNNKVVKRKGRSKTIARGEKPPCRETSFDELSLTCPEPFRKTGEKRARSEDEEELLSNDELHTFEETDLEKEQYQPRPSLRRSKSTPTNTPRDGADLELPKARAVRKKSSKATDTLSHSALGDVELSTETPVQASIIRDDSAMAASLSTKDTTEARARQTGSSSSKSIGNSHITTEEPADVPLAENVPTVPAQAKKRGRKKTSEIVAVKSSGVSKTQSADFVPVTSKDNEAQRKVLQETDSNKQPLQETASTPPTKASATNVTGIPPPTQTPTKDSKKGPDQHSPLQSGKVPYRVGLSKKTRIAPLLKMIRK